MLVLNQVTLQSLPTAKGPFKKYLTRERRAGVDEKSGKKWEGMHSKKRYQSLKIFLSPFFLQLIFAPLYLIIL